MSIEFCTTFTFHLLFAWIFTFNISNGNNIMAYIFFFLYFVGSLTRMSFSIMIILHFYLLFDCFDMFHSFIHSIKIEKKNKIIQILFSSILACLPAFLPTFLSFYCSIVCNQCNTLFMHNFHDKSYPKK